MKTKADDGRFELVVRLLLFVAALTAASTVSARAQGRDDLSREESFEPIDPYTKGDPAALAKAGYISFGPFPWCEGVKTDDLRTTLGGVQMLWAETAHFKIGCGLRTYKLPGDAREKKKLDGEFERLKERIERFKPPTGKLDPWLRLHLLALRLEEQYSDFTSRFGIKDEQFKPVRGAQPVPGQPEYMGEGPYLGMPMKFTVLVTEKRSLIGRYAQTYLKNRGDWLTYREQLPGGTFFFGTSAEGCREFGQEFDAVLHCTIAADMTFNLCDGYRNCQTAAPLWFKQGLSFFYSRRIDERFTVYAKGTQKEFNDDSWKWEPRIRGLVENNYIPKWADMFAWDKWDAIEARGHMVVWSRVAWMMSRRDTKFRELLDGFSHSVIQVKIAEQAARRREQTLTTLQAVYGKTPEALDEEWRAWVMKTYPKK